MTLFDGLTLKERANLCDLIDAMDSPTPSTVKLRADLASSVLAELNIEDTPETETTR